jgi:hypothetical protein
MRSHAEPVCFKACHGTAKITLPCTRPLSALRPAASIDVSADVGGGVDDGHQRTRNFGQQRELPIRAAPEPAEVRLGAPNQKEWAWARRRERRAGTNPNLVAEGTWVSLLRLTRPVFGAGREAPMDAESLRLLICEWPECRQLVHVCSSCDHGRRYCSVACSEAARTASKREARRLHQASDEGRARVGAGPARPRVRARRAVGPTRACSSLRRRASRSSKLPGKKVSAILCSIPRSDSTVSSTCTRVPPPCRRPTD